MRPLESTQSGLATEMMINAGCLEGLCPRRESTSSGTPADGKSSKGHSGRQWDSQQAANQADAGTCRSLSFLPWNSATML